ncbi:haloacid dehalogenase-like hydrolase domain-containing protein Sgpp isoform X2 [Phragmites australis]|uniref:haloacid dehalogenase-like hydrolase domain-containing protein Sgpp isoform X2 n=1 Tax=Phragmites australis TaxID=29695 RepID=UPI002D7757B0|nr:haloacid dehalogenase-like hydrolase domain-containing protein Sgpp isoform X2 [Phragmites australis]
MGHKIRGDETQIPWIETPPYKTTSTHGRNERRGHRFPKKSHLSAVSSRVRSPLSPPPTRIDRVLMAAPTPNGNPTVSSLTTTVPVEAVLFDIDGTLCDSDPLHHVAFQEMLLEIGYNNGVPIDDEFFIKNIAGRSDVEAAQNLFPDWELEKGLKFLEEKEAKYRSLAKERLEPVKGLGKVVQWVKDHGYKCAAVTNAPRINAELMISLLGLSDFFQAVIVGGECEKPKPAPYPYLKAIKELQVSAEHTFIFEDSASGIRAGVAAGIPVIGVATRNPEKSLLEAGATLLIKDYEDPKLWAALEEIDGMEAKLKKGSV